MARKPKLKVITDPPLVAGRGYPVCVREIKIGKRSGVMVVVIEHLADDQEGRVQEARLPLPVRQSGRTGAFFRACGMEVMVNAEIAPENALGKRIMAGFELRDGASDWEPVWFGPFDKETRDERQSR